MLIYKIKKLMDGMSNRAFSKKCGISEGAVRNILRGGEWHSSSLKKIAEEYEKDMAWFFLKEEPATPTYPLSPIDNLHAEVKEWVRDEYGEGAEHAYIGDFYERFPEFSAWRKKRKEGGDMDALPARKVSNFDK